MSGGEKICFGLIALAAAWALKLMADAQDARTMEDALSWGEWRPTHECRERVRTSRGGEARTQVHTVDGVRTRHDKGGC